MGRDVGDDLLRAVADRLSSEHRIVSAGRLAGDVFAVAVPVSEFASLENCADALVQLFETTLEIGGRKIHLGVRVGICHKTRVDHVQTWVEHAEQALDTAKAVAGSGWRAYEPASAARQQKSRELEHAMRASFQQNEFFLLYQPQVDLRSGAFVGAEALLRWQHPEQGLISPAVFVPVAEANGFIEELGRWALAAACREAAQWPDGLSVAVNVAPLQMIQGDLVADVKHASGLTASRLTLEITESAAVDQGGSAIMIMSELREMGVRIALDDFGTGYSSLSYMTGFPLDKLKIDQSFVRRMGSDNQSLAIVQMVKALAESLKLDVVAEGIEGEEERQLLSKMGCEFGQGYFFGKPQTSTAFLSSLSTGPWVAVA
jgi:predicted signal transduction protein with EAL and GGDEF domain